MKTLKELNKKIWYRFLKVVYVVSLIFCVGKSIVAVGEEVGENAIILSVLVVFLTPISVYIGFEIIRRVFYYIIFGTIKPADDTYFEKWEKNKSVIRIILLGILIILALGIWEAFMVDQRAITVPSSGLPELPKLPPLPKLPSLPPLPNF